MPMLKALLPFAGGIALAAVVVLPAWLVVAALLGCGAAALLLHRSRYLVVALLAAGYGATLLRPMRLTAPLDCRTLFEIRTTEPAVETAGRRRAEGVVTAWRDPATGLWYASQARVLLRCDDLAGLGAGERLLCRTRIRPIGGGSASYRRLMRRRGYVGSCLLTEPNLLERRPPRRSTLHEAAAESLRSRLKSPLSPAPELAPESESESEPELAPESAPESAPAPELAPEPNPELQPAGAPAAAPERAASAAASERFASAAAVVRAMTVGDRRGLPPALREAYARSGMAHLLAVSGLHTGIVFLFVRLLFSLLSLHRAGHRLRSLLVLAAVWGYVAAAGFPPGAVRAAVMCSILQVALFASSRYRAMNAWAAAALLLLFYRPAWLGDISFQLSFIAVAAILLWGVPLARCCRTGRRLLDWPLQALLIGLSASVATAPLVSYTFGIVPLAGILLNPPAVLLGSLVVAGGLLLLLLPPLGGVLAPAVLWIAEGQNRLALCFASLDGGVLEGRLSGAATAALYAGFAAATLLVWHLEAKKSVHLPL